jgi:hypothetical protein
MPMRMTPKQRRKVEALLQMTVERGCTVHEELVAKQLIAGIVDQTLRPWTTKDRRMMKMSEMETRHIWNCIRLIDRSSGWRDHYRFRLMLELELRSLQRKTQPTTGDQA